MSGDDISQARAYVQELLSKEEILHALSGGLLADLIKTNRMNGILLGVILCLLFVIVLMAFIMYGSVDRFVELLDTVKLRIDRLEAKL